MDFGRLVHRRKTTYAFSGRKIGAKAMARILEAGRWAPSSCNSQPWKFVVITSRKKISALLKSAFYGAFFTSPAAIIAIVAPRELIGADCLRGVAKGKVGSDELFMSLSLPAYAMSLQAEEMGLGSCLLTFHEDSIAKLIGLRTGDRMPLSVGIGYPHKKRAEGYLHEREPLAKLVLREKFRA
jgi:nitroreductase